MRERENEGRVQGLDRYGFDMYHLSTNGNTDMLWAVNGGSRLGRAASLPLLSRFLGIWTMVMDFSKETRRMYRFLWWFYYHYGGFSSYIQSHQVMDHSSKAHHNSLCLTGILI